MRICTEVSCGCTTPDCYKVTVYENVVIFTDEETNKQYSMSKDLVILGANTNSLAVDKKKVNKNSYARLKEFLGI